MIPSSGWYAEVTHPDTDRTLRPDILDEPLTRPSWNDYAEIEIPVPSAPHWQTMEGEPTLRVYKDGERVPIDILQDARNPINGPDMVLEGIGGIELRERVQHDFRLVYPEDAARTLVEDNTTLTFDLEPPTWPVQADQTLQDTTGGDTLSDLFSEALNDDTVPITESSGSMTPKQTCWVDIGGREDASGSYSERLGPNYSGTTGPDPGEALAVMLENQGQFVEWTFTTGHTIPEAEVGVWIRFHTPDGDGAEFTVELNGNEIDRTSVTSSSVNWNDFGQSPFDGGGWQSGDLPAGTHTIRVELTGSSGNAQVFDRATPVDNRYDYNFDDDVNSENDLDGPELYPDAIAVLADRFPQAFNLTELTLAVTMDDISNNQAIAVANAAPVGNFDEATNTASHTVDFDAMGDLGAIAQGRVTFSRYSPNGARDETPRFGYDAQTLTDWTLTADIEEVPMLIDRSFDASIAEVLTDIAGQSFVWSYRIDDDGDETLTWLRPGDRVAPADPALIDAEVTKEMDVIGKATVKGANKQVTGESFTASTSFVDLAESDIIPQTESVGDNFSRGTDYEMNWRDGEIRILSRGDMVNGNTYTINYAIEVEGSYTADASLRALEPQDIPEVPSSRAAEQIAYVLTQELGTPRWVGNIRIPPEAMDFDVVDALPLGNIGLPSDAGPFAIIDRPQITPQGIQLRLGNRPDLDALVAQLQQRVRQVVRRT